MDTTFEQEVIEMAKLGTWQSFRHPDIEDVGAGEYEYAPPFVTAGLETVLVGNETLADTGIEFISVNELDVDQLSGASLDEFTFEEST